MVDGAAVDSLVKMKKFALCFWGSRHRLTLIAVRPLLDLVNAPLAFRLAHPQRSQLLALEHS